MSNIPFSLAAALGDHFGALTGIQRVGGGDTAAAAQVGTRQHGTLFIKYASGIAGRSIDAESDGLKALAGAAPAQLHIPEVLHYGQLSEGAATMSYLVLPWLQSVSPNADTWRSLGEGLARLHLAPAVFSNYGGATDNFLGLAPQKNTPALSWPEFYCQSRLLAMRDYIRSIGRWTDSWDAPFDRLCADLANRLPAKPRMSQVHGDLWIGNVLHLANGKAALIDPATYVGDAEVDLAFSRLFGGFDAMFYESYYAIIPREPGYEERQDIYQLYHLIMHLAVSPSYASGVQRMLHKLVE